MMLLSGGHAKLRFPSCAGIHYFQGSGAGSPTFNQVRTCACYHGLHMTSLAVCSVAWHAAASRWTVGFCQVAHPACCLQIDGNGNTVGFVVGAKAASLDVPQASDDGALPALQTALPRALTMPIFRREPSACSSGAPAAGGFGSVPDLLLNVVSAGGTLASVTHVQRLNTIGGGCVSCAMQQ